MSASFVVDSSHPALNTPEIDYTAVRFNPDGTTYLADRYLNLPPAMQRYILALAVLGPDGLRFAERLASCCRAGHVSKYCDRWKYALGRKHHCGDPLCVNDSSGRYRFNKWATRREHSAFLQPHTGLEIKLAQPWPYADHKKIVHKLRRMANQLLRALTPNSISVEAFAEKPADVSIRAVYPKPGHSFSQIRKHLTDLKLDKEIIVTLKVGTSEELFHWAFNGFHECAAMDPVAKANLRIKLMNHHSVAVLGKLYRQLSDAEAEAQHKDEPCQCPVCKDHDLIVVPREEHQVQPVEDIEEAYEHVDWSRENREHLSPFLIRKEQPTDKLSKGDDGVRTFVPATAGPPS